MTRVCLDTSAYSNFRRGDRQVTQHLDRAGWIGQAGGAVVTCDEHFREIGRVGTIVLSPAGR